MQMYKRRYGVAFFTLLFAALMAGCAAPGAAPGDPPHAFMSGATIDQVQNAIIAQEIPKGWTIVQQSANILVLQHPINNFLFTAMTGAKSSVERATYQFVREGHGTGVLGSVTLIADQGFGNTETISDGRAAGAMQAFLYRVQAQIVRANNAPG